VVLLTARLSSTVSTRIHCVLQVYQIISWQARENSQGNLLYHTKWVLTDSLTIEAGPLFFPGT
jgi:hypothetical protein